MNGIEISNHFVSHHGLNSSHVTRTTEYIVATFYKVFKNNITLSGPRCITKTEGMTLALNIASVACWSSAGVATNIEKPVPPRWAKISICAVNAQLFLPTEIKITKRITPENMVSIVLLEHDFHHHYCLFHLDTTYLVFACSCCKALFNATLRLW